MQQRDERTAYSDESNSIDFKNILGLKTVHMKRIQTQCFDLAVYLRGKRTAKKLAVVLPGRLDTKGYPHMRSHVNYLARRGYLALSFDPPGTWESAGGIEQYTMSNYLAAINELIAYFGNKDTILVGHSRGGSMAMLAATHNRYVTRFVAIMSRPTPSGISEAAKKYGFEISYRDTPSGGKKEFKVPLRFFQDSLQYNMTDALSTCVKPKLFILGTKDTVVPPDAVNDAYNTSAAPKQLVEIDSDHDYRRNPRTISIINRVIGRFLDTQDL